VLERLNDNSGASEQLQAVIAAKPVAPFGAYADAQRELMRLNARTRSVR
jgi:hypothetical protein